MKRITVVSLPSGDPEMLNSLTLKALRGADPLFLRTERHPLRPYLAREGISYRSFDRLYEQTEDFDGLYRAMAEALWQASDAPNLVYGVPDPLSDESVRRLFDTRPSPEDEIMLIPGVGTADRYLCRCRDAWEGSDLRLVAASALPGSAWDPNRPLLVTEIDSGIMAGELKAFLSGLMADEDSLLFFDDPDHAPRPIPLYELDRQKAYDHRTAILIPGRDPSFRSRFSIDDLERRADEQTACFLRSAAGEADDEAGPDPEEEEDALSLRLLEIIRRASLAKARGEFDLRDVISRAWAQAAERNPAEYPKK